MLEREGFTVVWIGGGLRQLGGVVVAGGTWCLGGATGWLGGGAARGLSWGRGRRETVGLFFCLCLCLNIKVICD